MSGDWYIDQGTELFTAFLSHMLEGKTPNEKMRATARRYTRWFHEQTRDPEPFKFSTFKMDGYDQMVAVGPVRFHTLCEHHLLPFSGEAFVAYLPSKTVGVVGLSKLARAVRVEATGINIQERMTHNIATRIHENLKPRFTMVLTRARHSCMEIRGVKSEGTITSCSYILPKSRQRDETLKAEAFRLWGLT